MRLTYIIEDLPQVANAVLNNTEHKTILFYGEMGVGKTTLIKELAKKIGVTDTLSSPTFSIVNEYSLYNDKLNHFDCYRLKDIYEAMDIGIEEYLDSGNWNLIEWPEKITSILPESKTEIKLIKNINGSRTLNLI